MITCRVRGLRLRLGLGSLAVIAVSAIGLSPTTGVVAWIGTVATMLATLAVHETVRAWTWQRLGVRVRGLEATVFGARPELADATVGPRAETLAGLAGLAVLASLAATALLVVVLADAGSLGDVSRWIGVLLIVHAMPALPLDAGRIVRAWAWYLTDDALAGTRAASIGALVISGGLAGLGLALFLLDPGGALPYWGVWLFVAGWQVGGAARAESRHARWQRDGRAVTLEAAVAAHARGIAATASLADAVDPLLGVGDGGVLLVVAGDNRPVGILRLRDLRRVRRADWERQTVGEAMASLDRLPRLDADLSIVDAVAQLTDSGHDVGLVQRDGTTFAAATARQLASPLPEREDVADESPIKPEPSPGRPR